MELKYCKYCDQEKEISAFVKSKDNKTTGYGGRCKQCANTKQQESRLLSGDINTKRYEKTFNGYLMRTYRNMKSRVKGVLKKKAHLYEGLEILDKEVFYTWSKSNEDYIKLHKEWTDSGYEARLVPSIDRVDSSKGYVLENMRWITHSENSRLGNESRFNKM